MKKIWRHKKIQDAEQFELFKKLLLDACNKKSLPPTPLPIIETLFKRGIDNMKKAVNVFSPKLENLHDPFLMKDMDKAVSRIEKAIEGKEKIMVFGDYDVDGTTATAMVFDFFSKLTDKIEYYLPHRMKEGYGVSMSGVQHADDHDIGLLITVDCGISSFDSIQYCKDKGIDVIICDHHLPKTYYPNACAILDPLQEGCNYPYKYLSGCGVGFKLIAAYAQRNQMLEEHYLKYLDLVCLSIASDIVPMTGENRLLAHAGLEKINQNPCLALACLKRLAGLEDQYCDIDNLVFRIGPSINAAGRMSEATKAVQLLLSKKEDEAETLAEDLFQLNKERKQTEQAMLNEAIQQIESNENFGGLFAHVVFNPEWHKGVLGIVASKLMEKYRRPCIVLTENNDKTLCGSGRTTHNINLYEMVHQCKHLLLQFGGHEFAVGLTMESQKLEAFKTMFEQIISKSHTDKGDFLEQLTIDAELEFSAINPLLIKYLNRLKPHGPSNMTPCFMAKKVFMVDYPKEVGDGHISMSLSQDQHIVFRAIGFDLASKCRSIKPFEYMDIVYTIEERTWNGNKKIQLVLKDIKEK